ncbi:MAG: septal ring lytic transglycosylase RlpA family protein [Acidobacteria bacterium]|nr:septal ring lytic transglycosylase RlpA family protein [Acidobacteriota bacterium]
MPDHNFLRPESRELRAAALLAVAVVAGFLSTGCHRRRQPAAVPRRAPAPIIQGEQGIASWYGHPYHGRRAASGEIYNMHDMTAAHRTLPFGARVRVYNLENGRNTTVRINDRGPFVAGRIIDLSHAAAQAIGMSGLAPVRLEILGLGTLPPPGTVAASGTGPSPKPPGDSFAVQVGAFADRRNADALRDAISPHFGPVAIQTFERGDGVFYRVRVGNEKTEQGAHALGEKLQDAGFADETFVVRLD